MIYLYHVKSCIPSKKAIQWFKKYGIEISLKSPGQMSREDIIMALSSTTKGLPDLIKHPRHFTDHDESSILSMNKMTLNQAIDRIKTHPHLLKTPIIVEKDKVLIGYNPEQIRIFLPREYRRKVLLKNAK